MLYHSKKPTVHYVFPKEYIFPKGDFDIYDTTGAKKSVNKQAIASYKISNIEAMLLLKDDIKNQVTNFVQGLKRVTNNESSESKEPLKEETINISKTINKGMELLTLTTKTMNLFWKIHTTNNDEELVELKQQMIVMKEEFMAKGYPIQANFEEIPFQLKEKYKEEGKLDDFQEAAAEFKKALGDLKFK